MERLVYCISYLQLCCSRNNDIYGMIQVIGIIGADHLVHSFMYIWTVVPDDELLSITILGGDFFVTNSGVNIFYPLRRNCRIFFRKVILGCVCVIHSKSFGIICFRSEAVGCMDIYSMVCRVNDNILVSNSNSSRG